MLFDQKEHNILIKNILKRVIGQVFSLNISYDIELQVEGTLGITVDHQKSFIFHFDDKLDASQNKTSTLFDRSEHLITSFLSDPLNFRTSFPSTPSNSASSILSEINGFDPIEADPQLEIEIESINQNTECNNQPPDDVLPKMMGVCAKSVSNDKFDPLMSACIISDSENDISFSPQNLDATKRERRSVRKSLRTRLPKKVYRRDSKESVYNKIDKLKRKTVMFAKKTDDQCLDTLDVESNISNFSFECSLEGGTDSKFTIPLGGKTEGGRPENRRKLNVCEVCGLELKSISQLEGHLVSKHGITDSLSLGRITSFSCPVCRKCYRFQAQLVKHCLKHEAKRPFACRLCRNSYRCEESLKLHMQVHGSKVDLECHVCMKSYDSKILFQKHIAYMHEKVIDDKAQRICTTQPAS